MAKGKDHTLEFLEKWITTREALIEKHRLKAEHWKHKHGCDFVYAFEYRKVEKYTDERNILIELREMLLRHEELREKNHLLASARDAAEAEIKRLQLNHAETLKATIEDRIRYSRGSGEVV